MLFGNKKIQNIEKRKQKLNQYLQSLFAVKKDVMSEDCAKLFHQFFETEKITDNTQNANNDSVIDGHLLLFERFPMKRWVKKWVYVIQKTLFIKNDKQDDQVWIQIHANEIFSVHKVVEKGNYEFAFEIWTAKTQLKFCAVTEREMMKWITALTLIIVS